MRRLVRNDLGMEAYKLHKLQLLTQLNKQKTLKRCKAMISRYTDGRHKQILFSDEKLFTGEQANKTTEFSLLIGIDYLRSLFGSLELKSQLL